MLLCMKGTVAQRMQSKWERPPVCTALDHMLNGHLNHVFGDAWDVC